MDDNEKPGEGWTNGSIAAAPIVATNEGRVKLYSQERRWISSRRSWSRIGSGSALDKRHSVSGSGASTVKDDEDEAKIMKSLIAQLCERFYKHGWATGTGGGVSIRVGGPDEGRPWRVFVAPSGVQKEDMIGNDVFEMNMDQQITVMPQTPGLKLSACTPLWFVVYKHRPSTKCVIHTHSQNAQLATLLDPSEKSEVFRITHLEMLKGVGNHAYDDVLEVPIIDNRPTEDMLAAQLEHVINKYPKANAVLVRRHGIYAWGDSWEQAKTQCESFDYLFESAIKMRQMGIPYEAVPLSGTYRVDNEVVNNAPPVTKKRKLENVPSSLSTSSLVSTVDASAGFKGVGQADNSKDLSFSTNPLLPRDAKVLLLDIEGCTTSISFVMDVLFPYVTREIGNFANTLSDEQIEEYTDNLRLDLSQNADAREKLAHVLKPTEDNPKIDLVNIVKGMVKLDVKATGLKELQGHMWKHGYSSGEIKGHVYSDLKPLFDWCKQQNVQINIYSSGSVGAQKLLFGNSVEGDLTPYISNYFDTKVGGKKTSESYKNIAQQLGVPVEEIVFVSDAEAELVAARSAGIGFPVMSIRPGNAPLTGISQIFSKIYSLLQLCGGKE